MVSSELSSAPGVSVTRKDLLVRCCILLALTLHLGVCGAGQVFTVRPDSIQARAGEDVLLRCIVYNQQGNVQWTKDGFALGFERDVPGYPRYRYGGDAEAGENHLVIKGVTLQDDGEYQCQVGPGASTGAIWAAANLTVLVSPQSISVSGRRDGAVVEVVAGDPLTLTCLVLDARPPPTVAWYRSGLRLDPALHEDVVEQSSMRRRWSVRSRLTIHPAAEDDLRQYSCRALHPALRDSPTSLVASVVLSVQHPPSPPTISGYSSGEVLTEGDERVLTCHVEGGKPRPRVTWYRHGRPLTSLQSLARRAEGEGGDGGVTVTQLVKATRREDGAVYECRVTSPLLEQPFSVDVTLTVHYSPERVMMSGPKVVRPGQHFSLTCVTSPATPPAAITWMIQGLQSAEVPYMSEEAEDGGWVTTSELTPHHLKLHEVTEISVSCRAFNAASDLVVSDTTTVTVTKRPGQPVLEIEPITHIRESTGPDQPQVVGNEVVAGQVVSAVGQVAGGVGHAVAGGGGQVVAGQRVGLVCSSEGGNPAPVITWNVPRPEGDAGDPDHRWGCDPG